MGTIGTTFSTSKAHSDTIPPRREQSLLCCVGGCLHHPPYGTPQLHCSGVWVHLMGCRQHVVFIVYIVSHCLSLSIVAFLGPFVFLTIWPVKPLWFQIPPACRVTIFNKKKTRTRMHLFLYVKMVHRFVFSSSDWECETPNVGWCYFR